MLRRYLDAFDFSLNPMDHFLCPPSFPTPTINTNTNTNANNTGTYSIVGIMGDVDSIEGEKQRSFTHDFIH